MNIHIIGARAYNPIPSLKVRKHASARVTMEKTTIQIDVGNPWRGRAEYLLVTHLHEDHIGKIHTVPKATTVLVPHKSFLKELQKRTRAPIQRIMEACPTQVGSFSILPFRVDHSKHTKAFGYRLEAGGKSMLWLPDYRQLRGVIKYFRNLDALFIGASCWKRHISHPGSPRYGHMAILSTLRALQRNNIRPKRIVLMHLGKQLTPIEQKEKAIRALFPEFDIAFAKDNLRFCF